MTIPLFLIFTEHLIKFMNSVYLQIWLQTACFWMLFIELNVYIYCTKRAGSFSHKKANHTPSLGKIILVFCNISYINKYMLCYICRNIEAKKKKASLCGLKLLLDNNIYIWAVIQNNIQLRQWKHETEQLRVMPRSDYTIYFFSFMMVIMSD